MQASVESKIGKALPGLRAVSFRTQVVAGINYLIEAQSGAEFYHVKVFKPLPHTQAPPEVSSVTGPHAAGTELA